MSESPYNRPMTVQQLEARCRADRVDIQWEGKRPDAKTVVTVDDEKHGIWDADGQYLGVCIVW